MTPEQREACARTLFRLSPDELHHGDAIGRDSEAHELATNQDIRVVIHPPVNPSNRAFCEGSEVRAEFPYMLRNRAIVAETDLLLATPNGPEASAPRSGTWRTVRYARRMGRRIVIIYPSGDITEAD